MDNVKNIWSQEIILQNSTANKFISNHDHVYDALSIIGAPASFSQIINVVLQIKENLEKRRLTYEEKKTTERRVSEILKVERARRWLKKTKGKWWCDIGVEFDNEGWNISSKRYPKKAWKLAETQIYQNKKLTKVQMNAITFELNNKLLERYGRAMAMYEASKFLHKTKVQKIMELNYRYEKQTLVDLIGRINDVGFLQELYNSLNRLDLDDEKSCQKIDKKVAQLYKKFNKKSKSPKI